MRILLVEDEEEFALFAKKGFEAKGFAVDVATSGEAGLQKARLNSYAAIVLDMSLPGTLQGPAVLKDLREFKPSIPILMISGGQVRRPLDLDGVFGVLRAHVHPDVEIDERPPRKRPGRPLVDPGHLPRLDPDVIRHDRLLGHLGPEGLGDLQAQTPVC